MRVLITGGLGFIGSQFVRHTLTEHPDDTVVNLDAMTYAGQPANLADVEKDFQGRYRWVKGDVCDSQLVMQLVDQADAVVHFAAESHVDRSIVSGAEFVRTNVLGTQTLLQAANQVWGNNDDRRLVYISTDEVYGALALEDTSRFHEDWPLSPRSPYSASKAGGDMLAQAYHHTHGLPVLITRCSNNYGPRQYPEKFIPLIIFNTLEGKAIPIYGDGQYVRDWIHVSDNCRATDMVLRQGRPGEVYNIGVDNEKTNLEVVDAVMAAVCELAGLDLDEKKRQITHVKDRLGHDRRYAINPGKIQSELGFSPEMAYAEGIRRTVAWYLDNAEWREQTASESYREYYLKMYHD